MKRSFTICFLAFAWTGLSVVSGYSQSNLQLPWLAANVRSVGEVYADLNYLTSAVGAGALGQLVAMTTRQYASGLDQRRPVLLTVDSPQPESLRWLIYLPISDQLDFATVATPFGNLRRLENGLWKLEYPDRPLFVRKQMSWAIISDRPEAFSAPLPDERQVLPLLGNRYDVNFRLQLDRVPQRLKQKWAAQIQQQVHEKLASFHQSTSRDHLARLAIQELGQQTLQLLQDTRQVSCHWNTDRDGRKSQLDIQLTAIDNTLTAARMQQFQMQRSSMASVLDANGAATWNAIGTLPKQDIARLEQLFAAASRSLLDEVKNSEQFTTPGTQHAAQVLANAILETCHRSLRTGYFDGAGMMTCDAGQIAAGTAMQVSDTQALVVAMESLLANAASTPEIQIQRMAGRGKVQHGYIISMPTPQDASARQLLGPRLEFALGFSPQRLYVAFGKGSSSELGRMIDATNATAAQDALPFHSRVRIAPVLRFLSAAPDLAATGLTSTGTGSDHFLVQAEPLPNGVRFRMEADQEVLRAAGYLLLSARSR